MPIKFSGYCGLTRKRISFNDYHSLVDPFTDLHRLSILKSLEKYKIVQAVRQSGKTRMIIDYAIAAAATEPGSTICIAAPNQRMKEMIRRELLSYYYRIPDDYKPGFVQLQKDRITFSNGSNILFTSGSSRFDEYIGLRIDHFLIDELAYYENTKWLMEAVECLGPNSKVMIVSTRKNRSKKNPFWKLWLGALNGTNLFTPFTIRVSDCPRLKDIAKTHKRNMSRSAYETEFGIRKR